jgi:hypothetical protein
MSSPVKAKYESGQKPDGFVEAYLDGYDAVLRQHGTQNAVYFAAITVLP